MPQCLLFVDTIIIDSLMNMRPFSCIPRRHVPRCRTSLLQACESKRGKQRRQNVNMSMCFLAFGVFSMRLLGCGCDPSHYHRLRQTSKPWKQEQSRQVVNHDLAMACFRAWCNQKSAARLRRMQTRHGWNPPFTCIQLKVSCRPGQVSAEVLSSVQLHGTHSELPGLHSFPEPRLDSTVSACSRIRNLIDALCVCCVV